jgi:arylsulfatase A-like enzyme
MILTALTVLGFSALCLSSGACLQGDGQEGLTTKPAPSPAASRPAQEKRPNVVLLYSDDAGYADFGFQAQASADLQKLTPNIDSIASQGVVFSNAYMSGCVCSPSRAGMLTGRYQSRFGHENNIPPGYMKGGMDLGQKTMADRVKALGYRTGLVGKWHLGYPQAYQPNRRGFDWFLGLLQGARPYFPMRKPTPHRVLQLNGKALPEKGYVTDRFGDAAISFLEEQQGKGPFLLFVSFTAPHGPLQAKAEDLKALGRITQRKRRRYAGLIKSLDDNVGRILDTLKATGLDKNTLVIFTNDNGGQTMTGAVNAPLRGRKGQLWEGGIRVPMCMRWPGRIEAGSRIDEPVISLDFLPTFVELAGGKVDEAWKLDGVSLLPRLLGRQRILSDRVLYWRKGGPGREIALRRDRYKLHFSDRSKSDKPELYDLAKDIGERTDIAADNEALVKELCILMQGWEKQLENPRWAYGRLRRK